MKTYIVYSMVCMNGVWIARAVHIQETSSPRARVQFAREFPGYEFKGIKLLRREGNASDDTTETSSEVPNLHPGYSQVA